MKRLSLPFFVMVCLFFITSCSEKFKVAAPYKNITVVYGFLDMADTAHYIRIQKAFLDQNKSAITMAQSSDSNFYTNLNVRIERYAFVNSGAWHDTIHMNRVDLDAEGYPKQPGIFFQSPNYAYKFTQALDPNYIYRIKIINLNTGLVDSADAPIINNKFPNFYVDAIDDTVLNKAGMDFSSTLPKKYYEITGNYIPAVNYSFNGASTPAAITQAIIRLNWTDSNNVTFEKTDHYYDVNLGFAQVPGNNFMDFKAYNLDLYSAFTIGMGQAPQNIYRLVGRTDVYVYLSTTEFYNYEQASLTQGTGLTGSEIEPVYTNIKGPNALGLFTSKAMRTAKVTITSNTIDSLMNYGPLDAARIVGTSYHQ